MCFSFIFSMSLYSLDYCDVERFATSSFPSSILGTYWPGGSSLHAVSFCLFVLFMGFSRQECWSGLPSPLHGPGCQALTIRGMRLSSSAWLDDMPSILAVPLLVPAERLNLHWSSGVGQHEARAWGKGPVGGTGRGSGEAGADVGRSPGAQGTPALPWPLATAQKPLAILGPVILVKWGQKDGLDLK